MLRADPVGGVWLTVSEGEDGAIFIGREDLADGIVDHVDRFFCAWRIQITTQRLFQNIIF